MNLKESGEDCMGGFGGREGKENCEKFIILKLNNKCVRFS